MSKDRLHPRLVSMDNSMEEFMVERRRKNLMVMNRPIDVTENLLQVQNVEPRHSEEFLQIVECICNPRKGNLEAFIFIALVIGVGILASFIYWRVALGLSDSVLR